MRRRFRIHVVHAHHGRDYWPAIMAARSVRPRARVVLTRHLAAFRARLGWLPEHAVCAVAGSFGLPRGKGQFEFLQAAQCLRQEFPEARFALVGRGKLQPALQERIQSARLSDIVQLLPFADEMPLVMNAVDLLALPAVGTEALGLALWEAMASGKPVVASDLGGIPEAFVHGEHGLLTPPGDVPALAAAIRALLTDPARRARFGLAGRAHVLKHFSRRSYAERMRQVYLELLECA